MSANEAAGFPRSTFPLSYYVLLLARPWFPAGQRKVGAGDWEGGEALGQTWQSRNAFSYGKGGERGQARPEVLEVRDPS